MNLDYDKVYNYLLKESGAKSLIEYAGLCSCAMMGRCRSCLARQIRASVAKAANEVITREVEARMSRAKNFIVLSE